MPAWFAPTLAAFLCWGLWAFLPKLTMRYIAPNSAIVYEAIGGVLVALLVLGWLGWKPETDPRGAVLAVATGMLGILGALAYLYAMRSGPVVLIATLTALYPLLAILLAVGVLHEPISWKQGLGIVLGLVAMALIAG